jgi:hypothetical protein
MDIEGAAVGKPRAEPSIPFTKPYIYWAMAIDGEARIIGDTVEHDDDDFASACKHLTNMKV